jgi:hypothetical protein
MLVNKMEKAFNSLLISKVEKDYAWPDARSAHTFLAYEHYLVVFGGAGPFLRSIKMRMSYNDVFIFDCNTERWWTAPPQMTDEAHSSPTSKVEKPIRPLCKRMN